MPPPVHEVRRAIAEVDRVVLAAHGIADRFEHTLQHDVSGTRFGVGPAAEAAIKARLLGTPVD